MAPGGFGAQAGEARLAAAANGGPAGHTIAAATSMFKRSHIPMWCDGPDDYRSYNVDVLMQDMNLVVEADVPPWREFVAARHAAGQLVCAEMRPLTHMGRMLEWAMNDAGMQEAVCRDLDLQPIPISWMKEHPYQGRVPPFYCSNHPRYREFLRQQIRMFVQTGADAVMVDDGGGSPFVSYRGGCFCRHCVDGFRAYLSNKYPAARLREQGVENPATFDYRRFALQRAGDLASYKKLVAQGQMPFSRDLARFLRESDVELFRELQALASRLSGRHIPMGWDNVDCGGQYAPYYPFWDAFFSEITYQNFHGGGKGPANVLPLGLVVAHKLTDALGKWYTPTPGPRSWQAIMEGNLTGLLRQWIAFTYANGGAMRYPRKGWVFSEATPWYFPPQAEFEPLYAFIRQNRGLFDDYEAVEQVGVLFTQTTGGFGVAYYSGLKQVCASLVTQQIPFGFALAGDEQLANRLTGGEAARFEVMLIPEPIRLIDGQQAIVERWKAEGKAIAIAPGDDVRAKIGDRVKSFAALEGASDVWLFPRVAPGAGKAPVVCHLVTSKYDAKANQTTAQTNVRVRLSAALWGRSPARRVTYHAINRAPRELPFESVGSAIRVTVPEVNLWGILKVEP